MSLLIGAEKTARKRLDGNQNASVDASLGLLSQRLLACQSALSGVAYEMEISMLLLLMKASPAFKRRLRNVGHRLGFDIRLNGINSRDDLRFVHFLNLHGIETVLDVGANKGQFARHLFASGYDKRILSIEPVPAAHQVLCEAAAASKHDWRVGPQVALSNENSTATYFVTKNDTSSSLLEPLDSFVEATPSVDVARKIDMETTRLDAIYPMLHLEGSRVLLKLDVQGSEEKVLAGASKTLKSLTGVLVELSLTDLYAGQSSALALQQHLADEGFEIWDIWRGYHHPTTYRLNQVDALFFRGSPPSGA